MDWTNDSDRDLAEAALCLWEAMLDNASGPWGGMWERVGSANMRLYTITVLAPAAETLWLAMAYENAPVCAELQTARNASYDFDWIPAWLTMCVDWSGASPVILGDAHAP